MIPYFSLTKIQLGALTLRAWGALAALGFAVSFFIGLNRVKKEKLSVDTFYNLFCWIILLALVFSRLFYCLWGGELDYFLQQPWQVLAFWQGGLSSIGGFFGVALAIVIFKKRHKPDLWPYLDILAFSFPFGWFFGRLGCSLIHDHPGRLTNSIFAVNFATGARFDLGLLEAGITAVLALIFLVFSRKKRSLGFYSVFLLFWYGLTRFFLDFLRATDLVGSDPRFIGLTVGQWGSLVLIILGVTLWKKFKTK